jgi:hypothetical protein
MVIVLATGPKVCPAVSDGFLRAIKIHTQHDFLRRGSKAVGPTSKDFTACY